MAVENIVMFYSMLEVGEASVTGIIINDCNDCDS